MDRVTGFEPVGREFDSHRARQYVWPDRDDPAFLLKIVFGKGLKYILRTVADISQTC